MCKCADVRIEERIANSFKLITANVFNTDDNVMYRNLHIRTSSNPHISQ